MANFGIDDLSTVNIVCDRGANFLKAFRDLQPITCYGHRINNVLKRGFFQHQKQAHIPSTTANETPISDDEEDDDEDNPFCIPSKPIKVNENSNRYTTAVKEQTMAMKLVDTPPAAQLLVKTIVECKSLAKYIKKVSSYFIHYFQ
jgi:3-mercaptopyruvate sulfurtransferase SseA